MDYEFFEGLNRLIPGSVDIDRAARTVTARGWDLEQLVNSHCDKCSAENVKNNTDRLCATTSEGENTFPKTIFLINGRFKRVVYPLTDTPKNTSKRDKSSCTCGIGRKQACTIKQKNKRTYDYQHLVPVIKNQLGQRIFHYLSRLFRRG